MERSDNIHTSLTSQILNMLSNLEEPSLDSKFYISLDDMFKYVKYRLGEKERVLTVTKQFKENGINWEDPNFQKDFNRYSRSYFFDSITHIIVMKTTYLNYSKFFTESQDIAIHQLSDDFKNYLVHPPISLVSSSHDVYVKVPQHEIVLALNQIKTKFSLLFAERFVEK